MLLYFDWHGVKSAFAKWWPLSDTFNSYGSQEHFESGNPEKTLLLCNIEGNFIILSKQQSYQNRIDLSLPFTQRTSFCHHYQVFRCKKRCCVKSQLQKWWVLCMYMCACVRVCFGSWNQYWYFPSFFYFDYSRKRKYGHIGQDFSWKEKYDLTKLVNRFDTKRGKWCYQAKNSLIRDYSGRYLHRYMYNEHIYL